MRVVEVLIGLFGISVTSFLAGMVIGGIASARSEEVRNTVNNIFDEASGEKHKETHETKEEERVCGFIKPEKDS